MEKVDEYMRNLLHFIGTEYDSENELLFNKKEGGNRKKNNKKLDKQSFFIFGYLKSSGRRI